MKRLGSAPLSSCARRIAPLLPSDPGDAMTSASNRRKSAARSVVVLSGMTMRTGCPRSPPIIARLIPVFPEEGSRIVCPESSAPDASASSSIARAIRSLSEPVGLAPSSLAKSRTPGGARCGSSTIGVLQMEATRSWPAPARPALDIGLAHASGHGRQEDHGVVRPDWSLKAAPRAHVAVIDIHVHVLAQDAILADTLAKGRVALEEVIEHLGHGRARGAQRSAAADSLAQHRRDPHAAHWIVPSPQAGQAGSRQIFTSLNSVDMASNMRRRPTSVAPTPSSSLKTSLAWSMPAIPGSTPSTPATAQSGASSGGGWVGYMQR